MNEIKRFINEEDGMGTVEVVIIIAVLVALALVFNKAIIAFAKGLMTKFFDPNNVNVG